MYYQTTQFFYMNVYMLSKWLSMLEQQHRDSIRRLTRRPTYNPTQQWAGNIEYQWARDHIDNDIDLLRGQGVVTKRGVFAARMCDGSIFKIDELDSLIPTTTSLKRRQ